ncbi:MAG: SDR family oxidoreductase [Pseudomonadota bacterium]
MTGKVALITGGGRGIGKEFAGVLTAAGWRVMLTAARSREELEATVADLRAAQGEGAAAGVTADAGREADAARAVAETLDRFGRLDALINNAGRGPREFTETFATDPLRFWELSAEGWAELIRSNVDGPFLTAKAAAPAMIAQGWGRIVNISTSRITMIRKGFAPYGPSKAALDAMTRIFAQDLEGTGVTVNTLLPGGATDTPFIPGEGPTRTGADLKLLPVHVMNEALLWLVSEASDGVTAGRFVGVNWDPTDPSACREDTGAPPLIL